MEGVFSEGVLSGGGFVRAPAEISHPKLNHIAGGQPHYSCVLPLAGLKLNVAC